MADEPLSCPFGCGAKVTTAGLDALAYHHIDADRICALAGREFDLSLWNARASQGEAAELRTVIEKELEERPHTFGCGVYVKLPKAMGGGNFSCDCFNGKLAAQLEADRAHSSGAAELIADRDRQQADRTALIDGAVWKLYGIGNDKETVVGWRTTSRTGTWITFATADEALDAYHRARSSSQLPEIDNA